MQTIDQPIEHASFVRRSAHDRPTCAAASGRKFATLFRDAAPSLAIVVDPTECALASCDIAGGGDALAAAILQPQNDAELGAIIAVARREGCALFPRGGGWSYSGGYTPSRNPAAIVDTARLRTLTIEDDASRVTVGAGVTWGRLYDTLDSVGLRVPSFGPLSGIAASVGGLVAQNGGFFGAASNGPIADGGLICSTLIAGNGDKVELTAGIVSAGRQRRNPLPEIAAPSAFGQRSLWRRCRVPRAYCLRLLHFPTARKHWRCSVRLPGFPVSAKPTFLILAHTPISLGRVSICAKALLWPAIFWPLVEVRSEESPM